MGICQLSSENIVSRKETNENKEKWINTTIKLTLCKKRKELNWKEKNVEINTWV